MILCPLCREGAVCNQIFERDSGEYRCDRCGQFLFIKEATHNVKNLPDSDRSLLSGYARECSETGSPVTITPDVIESILELAPKRVFDKAMKFLGAIERRTSYYGEPIKLEYSTDYSLAYAQNTNEFKAIRDYLCESGFLRLTNTSGMYDGNTFILLADGIAELEKHQQSNLESHKAFVAMWFTEENNLKQVYLNQIAPGIRKAGYEPIRIDFKEHNNDVVAEILSEIRQSRFVRFIKVL